MDREILRRLEKLNQLQLTEEQKDSFLAFYAKQTEEMAILDSVDTESVERMVHVMPIYTVVREDKVIKKYSREDLQKGAPETTEGYWQVPRLVE
ncbi:MAG: Asp-tRNA(Asn)/Glu-tRNA(Gln) amidotransferase subunit GatC [Clostridia bacterium]|nr:Asp-tRNA(Asn)/Glu-tRNA(Gln) amidotransferase subunit GatC [Oscillospiraceae bacterium]MBQ6701736.1 Asp-tRNA(Asn)/Glu-tRNA(Gln) amidotransferase subunit GatC [Clostridia bacterium]